MEDRNTLINQCLDYLLDRERDDYFTWCEDEDRNPKDVENNQEHIFATGLMAFYDEEELKKWKEEECPVKEKSDKLTPKQIEEYIEDFGDNCPYCKSKNFSAGSISGDSGQLFQDIWCDDCKKSWTDEYRLSGITELEDKNK